MSISARDTTGTTWDLLLDQSAASPRAVAVSPRAAYQAALFGRAVLVDVRTTRHPDRPTVPGRDVASGPDAALAHLRDGTPVLLVDADGALDGPASVLAAADPRLSVVVGGLDAWRRDGLPLARLAVAPSAA